ncbi:MAG: thiamine pyrophosphate-dependent enzyme [Actinomycetota bacterium]
MTDTVPTAGRDRVAHQRLDQVALLGPVSKRSVTVGPSAGSDAIVDLIAQATTWPAGAIHLDVDATATDPLTTTPTSTAVPPAIDERTIEAAEQLLANARRPLLIVGAEAAAVAATGFGELRPGHLTEVLSRFGAPVLTTYQAIGVVPTESDANAGIFTNGALERPVLDAADAVVTVGLDLVEPIPAPWTVDAPVLRLSSGPQEDEYLAADVDLVTDWPSLAAVLAGQAGRRWGWADRAAAQFRTEARAALECPPPPSGIGPVELVDALSTNGPAAGTVTVDAGAHFLAIVPRWPVDAPHRLLISNGLATMGYAVPAAIGAALARPEEPVLALTGDGGLAMTMAELETIARLDLPVSVVVFNDSALSLIEIKQGMGNGGRGAVRYRPTDFASIAEASGLDGVRVSTVDELVACCRSADWSRPRLIDAEIDPSAYRHLLQATRG